MRDLSLITLLVALLLLPVSCRQNGSNSTAGAKGRCLDVLLDTTATSTQIKEAVIPWADSLKAFAIDTASLKVRLSAQQFAYMTIQLLSEQAERLEKSGDPIPDEELNHMMGQLIDASSQWIYTVEEGIPSIWRDIYYVSNQNSSEPVDGYFHIMYLLPTDAESGPELHIFYPDSAVDSPSLLFRNHIDNETMEEDVENQELIPLKNWSKKNEREDGFPMYVSVGSGIAEKMLEYDLMYLLFRSGNTPEGESGENEIALLALSYFQDKYTDVVGFD